MNEIALDVVMRLARTTALISVAVVALYLLIRFGRLHSPHWRRVLTALALLQGVVWIQVPLVVPWYEASAPATDELQRLPDEQQNILTPADTPPLPIGARAVMPTAPILIERAVRPEIPPPREEPPAPMQLSWPLVIIGLWFGGIVAIVGFGVLRYVAFVRRLPPTRPLEPTWFAEFEEVRSSMDARARLRFQVTDALGPLLCWTPRGSLLLVPAELWRELTGAQRRAVLRHELAHFKRYDLLTSLLVRVLALPHWFNPLAWWAVREFDEAGEWICDDLAAGKPATEYARALVRLCEAPSLNAWPTTAARGSGVAQRVRRLLDIQTKEDSIMKQFVLVVFALAVLLLGVVRVELVAQPLPAANPKNGVAVRNAEVAAKQQAMIDAARATYDVQMEQYKLGTQAPNEVYVWSSYLRSSQVRVADSRQQVINACQEHIDRMQRLHKYVVALQREGARGGEADKFHATQFYVAEAELFLLEAKNAEHVRGLPAAPK
jgi:beta-lactamase regulating signal transducer with metallopeptidase domain